MQQQQDASYWSLDAVETEIERKDPRWGILQKNIQTFFWITSDNPRSEDPLKIIHEIQKGIKKNASCRVQPDRKIAIEEAILEAKRGML